MADYDLVDLQKQLLYKSDRCFTTSSLGSQKVCVFIWYQLSTGNLLVKIITKILQKVLKNVDKGSIQTLIYSKTLRSYYFSDATSLCKIFLDFVNYMIFMKGKPQLLFF